MLPTKKLAHSRRRTPPTRRRTAASSHSSRSSISQPRSRRRSRECCKLAPGGDLISLASPAPKAPAVAIYGTEGARRGRPSVFGARLGPHHLPLPLLSSCTQALARPDSAEHAARRAAAFRERFQPRAILARAAGPYSRPPTLSGSSGASGEGRTTVPPRGPLARTATPSQPPGPLPDARALPPAPAQELGRAAACRPGTACCKRHPRVRTCTFS